jgi:hypothetical protein
MSGAVWQEGCAGGEGSSVVACVLLHPAKGRLQASQVKPDDAEGDADGLSCVRSTKKVSAPAVAAAGEAAAAADSGRHLQCQAAAARSLACACARSTQARLDMTGKLVVALLHSVCSGGMEEHARGRYCGELRGCCYRKNTNSKANLPTPLFWHEVLHQ